MSVAIRGNVRIGGKVLANTTIGDYVAATGATDTTVLANLVAYLQIQNLWDSVRFFPFKSAQNKGSGTTVYGLGGWTSNNVTLVNGPTWGADGLAFDATDDRATWNATGIVSLSELYVFDVQRPVDASLVNSMRFGSVFLGHAPTNFLQSGNTSGYLGDPVGIKASAWGDHIELGYTGLTWTAGEKVQIVNRFAQTGSAMWKSKTTPSGRVKSTNEDYRPVTQVLVTNGITINAALHYGVYSQFVATTRVALLLCKTSLTQAQRETITDYLDAL